MPVAGAIVAAAAVANCAVVVAVVAANVRDADCVDGAQQQRQPSLYSHHRMHDDTDRLDDDDDANADCTHS